MAQRLGKKSTATETVNVDPAVLAEMGVTAPAIAPAEVKAVIKPDGVKEILAMAPLTPAESGAMFMIGSIQVASQQDALDLMISTSNLLKDIMERQKMYTTFSDKKGGVHNHPHVEAWQALAMLLGCTVRELTSTYRQDLNGFEAVAEVIRLTDGMRIGLGSGFCDFSEPGKAALYAAKSMSMTRAIAKSVKNQWGHIMKLAGFLPTPKEEIEDQDGNNVYGVTPVTNVPVENNGGVEAAQNEIYSLGLMFKLDSSRVDEIVVATFGEDFPPLPEQIDMYKATLHLAVRTGRNVTKDEVAQFMLGNDVNSDWKNL